MLDMAGYFLSEAMVGKVIGRGVLLLCCVFEGEVRRVLREQHETREEGVWQTRAKPVRELV